MWLRNLAYCYQRPYLKHLHSALQFSTMTDQVLQKAIVRYKEENARVELQFCYNFETKSRTFNLNRAAEEELSSVLDRMKLNVGKYLNRKNKRKLHEQPIDECMIKLLKSSSVLSHDLDTIEVKSMGLSEVSGDVSCVQAFVKEADHHLLQVLSQYYRLDINPPRVEAVSLPDNIMVGHLLYPNYLDLEDATLEDCLVEWYCSEKTYDQFQTVKSKMASIKWEKLDEGFTIRTTMEMIGKLIKVVVEPRQGDRCGNKYEAVARALVKEGPVNCPYKERHLHTTTHAPPDSARVVCYNLLADTYASTEFSATHLFPCCPSYALDGFYRKQLLIDEILGYRGDVVCLQEVDEDLFKYDLSRVLPLHRLQGCYAGKISLSTKEGAATFYNIDKFRLHETCNYSVSDELVSNPALADVWQKLQLNAQLEERITSRTTVLQTCVLERLPTSSSSSSSSDTISNGTVSAGNSKELLVVGNTHFYFHPDADHIRIVQSMVCVALLEQLVRRLEAQGHRVRVLLCGDLNSSPDTGVCQLVTEGRVDGSHPGWQSAPGEVVSGVEFQHGLRLASACGCPDYTNYVVNFNACLDWIFYQTDGFSVSKVVPLPPHEVVTAHTALPSVVIPSDHLALVADLVFK